MSIYQEMQDLEEMISNCFDPETGEVRPEDDEAYIQLKKELTTNGLERLAKVRANKQNCLDGIDSEIKRLELAKKREEKQIAWIESYMLYIYNNSEKDVKGKVKAGTFTIGTRKSVKTIVDDLALLPASFVVVKTEHKPDLKAIKEVIQNGVEVPGCHLEEKQNLTVA